MALWIFDPYIKWVKSFEYLSTRPTYFRQDKPRQGVVVASLVKEWGKVLMVTIGVMLANKVPCMDSMEVIHMTLIGYPRHSHRYFLSNKY